MKIYKREEMNKATTPISAFLKNSLSVNNAAVMWFSTVLTERFNFSAISLLDNPKCLLNKKISLRFGVRVFKALSYCEANS
jgi:hypothetical protein